MYPASHTMPPPQQRSVAPETFLLDQDAQQSLPQDSIVALQQVDNLKYFLISAPVDWSQDQYIRRFLLPTGEYVSCVLWNNLFHISGTDIVRCLAFRFQAFGRPVKNSKKFEEGIFSDLRNLKSGTDASLEEPKSPFLDFLYKNNCIRTQKKQKVFYWYSVPHDRLFLDALERDLKREKMGQEATTVAVSEPALSFEFDSSVSLFDQLTKAQQTNNSLYQGGGHPQSQPQSPSMRAQDSMPPPQMIPQQPQLQHSMHQTMPEEISVTQVPTYTQMAMPPMNPMPPLPAQVQKTREQSLGPVVPYDRNGIPVSQAQYRHSSMPTYMEYSPAPSFVSSHFEDYSTRGLSFEPITPPQHSVPNGNEAAYIANEDTGLYTAIPDLGMSLSYNPLMQMPPTSLPGPQYPSMIRPIQQSYPVLEGSPSYKQRRRRSSLSQGIAAAVTASGGVLNTPHAPHRPSDLRRSVSQTLMPMAETDESFHDSPTSVHNSQPIMSRHKELLELSHQSEDVAGMHPQMPMSQAEDFASFNTSDEYKPMNLHHAAVHRTANGVYRRARSATISELGPYPHKSHSCPIPMCGRLFKRLEHLKRHVRTHTQERPYICSLCGKAFSRSDNLAQHRRTHEANPDGSMPVEDDIDEDEGLDNLDESPSDDANYMAIPGMAPNGVGGMSNGVSNGHGHGHGLAGMNDLPTHVDMRSLSHTPMPMGPPAQVGVASGDYS